MSEIFDSNIEKYNINQETKYMYKDVHRVRGEVAMNLIIETAIKTSYKPYKVLSLACATGLYEEELVKKGYEVHGVDGAEQALKEAKKRGLITKQADLSNKIPYEKNSFDCVFAGELIEHVFKIRPLFAEVKRVLKPGGIFVMTTPNLARAEDRIKFLFGIAPRQTSPVHEYLYLHIRPFTLQSLKYSLEQCGFTYVTAKSNYVELQTPFKSFKSRLLAKMFPSLGSTLIVKAKNT